MPTEEEIAREINSRILADIKHFNKNLPERYSIAWGGYIAGLYEWSFISRESFVELNNLLPKVEAPDPIADIFAGREEDE